MTRGFVGAELVTRRSIVDCAKFDPDDRFDAWRDAINSSFVPLRAENPDPESWRRLRGTLISQSLGRVNVGTVRGAPARVIRSGQQIAQADPGHMYLNLQLRGSSVISQNGREAKLRPGDFALCDTQDPYILNFAEPHRMFVVTFPPEALRVSRKALSNLTATRFSGRDGLESIASNFLGAMSLQLDRGVLSQALSLSDAILDIVGAVFADRVRATGGFDKVSYTHAIRLRVEAYICARLADPQLTVASVAAAHNMSVRYLQKLFEEQNETPLGWIRHRRLEGSRRDLARPSINVTVASIGAGWGFSNAAAFSRAFRQHYGMTPSEYRAFASQIG